MKALLSGSLLLLSANLFAYKVAIFTDQADHTKAQEVINTFQNTVPFSQFDIEYEIVDIPSDELSCAPNPTIPRAPDCDTNLVSRRATDLGADQAMIVWNDPSWSGAGGDVPVMSLGVPAEVMLHEYMHTIGFADEYEYPANEAEFFCRRLCERGSLRGIAKAQNHAAAGEVVETNPVVICAGLQETNTTSVNLAYIHHLVSYQSDAEAKTTHQAAIAWFDNIGANRITTGDSAPMKLGTGNVEGEEPVAPTRRPSARALNWGLFRAKTCDLADPPLPTWMPSEHWTLMDQIGLGIGPEYEAIITSALESRGISRRTPDHTPEEHTTEPQNRNGSPTISR